jgi:hypothetical protein
MDGKYSPYMLTGDVLTRETVDSGLVWGIEQQATYNHFASGSNDVVINQDTINIVWEDASVDLAHRSIYYTRSTDDGATWSEPYWLDQTLDDSWDPTLATSNGKVYALWADARYEPDSSRGGLYLTRWNPQPDAVQEGRDRLHMKGPLSAYPNPFNSFVTINYSKLKGGEMGIYDVQGKLVRTLNLEGGENGKITWDATDASGNKVSSGEYFLEARTSQNATKLKLLYLK